MTSSARYLVGIDLGTTNTAVAYVDARSADKRVALFEVPQLVAPGELAPRRQLPSFLYQAGEHDLGPAETALPWDRERRLVVGELARAQGARMPERMVSSAKSWLCHGGVDRQAPILPWGSDLPDKLSPVDAQAAILRHVREAWDDAHRASPAPLAEQEVMVTVPASFDEAARELTIEAARRAGLGAIVLLEEPQAAFYAWIDSHPPGERAAAALAPGSRVLVFDVGGGTTDFTLISVGADGDSFERTAVGDHLLLGGDNVDLTLARRVEQRLVAASGRKLDALEWHGLVHSCRLAKEALLGDESIDAVPITVVGRGSRLIGGTRRDQVTRAELDEVLMSGFFPRVERGAAPQRVRGGLQELGGLPYAADPAVTRHLATFLARHEVDRVDAILFNGGAMTPASLRRRVVEQLAEWQAEHGAPRELSNRTPELAVAQGAAYYGLVRRGLGARIRGGTARSFYVGAASGGRRGDTAVCVAPKGLEEGSSVELDRDFELVTNRPVSFRLFSSSSRADEPGTLVPIGDGTPDITGDTDSDLLELPPIVTVLRAPGRARATVRLEVRITELGALEVWCVERAGDGGAGGRWRLSFDMRAGGAKREEEAGEAAGEPDPRAGEARALVVGSFTGASGAVKPAGLMKKLEEVLGARREEWSLATSRALFDAALEVEEERRRSPDHEARWLNLCGFCLRPGRGAPLDEWRSRQMWRVFNLGLVHDRAEACRLAWWIVWRRIAGGLTQGQQEQIYDRLAQLFLPSPRQKKKLAELKPTRQEIAEMWRTLANLERLTVSSKIKLGDELVRRLGEGRKAREDGLYFWALGRIGARTPLYGPVNAVVPPDRAGQWLAAVLDMDWPDPDRAAFPMAQLGRRTGDRARDLDDRLRARLADRLRGLSGGERLARLVEEVVALEAREERVALGDSLPAGLRLLHDDSEPPPPEASPGAPA